MSRKYSRTYACKFDTRSSRSGQSDATTATSNYQPSDVTLESAPRSRNWSTTTSRTGPSSQSSRATCTDISCRSYASTTMSEKERRQVHFWIRVKLVLVFITMFLGALFALGINFLVGKRRYAVADDIIMKNGGEQQSERMSTEGFCQLRSFDNPSICLTSDCYGAYGTSKDYPISYKPCQPYFAPSQYFFFHEHTLQIQMYETVAISKNICLAESKEKGDRLTLEKCSSMQAPNERQQFELNIKSKRLTRKKVDSSIAGLCITLDSTEGGMDSCAVNVVTLFECNDKKRQHFECVKVYNASKALQGDRLEEDYEKEYGEEMRKEKSYYQEVPIQKKHDVEGIETNEEQMETTTERKRNIIEDQSQNLDFLGKGEISKKQQEERAETIGDGLSQKKT